MDSVVHFEIPADDLDEAKRFYGDVFGWGTHDFAPGQYVFVVTTPVGDDQMPTTPGAINGGLAQRSPELRTPCVTIGVPSIDERIAQVVAAGGAEVTPRTEIPDMGFYAYVTDPAGNVVGLWETLPAA